MKASMILVSLFGALALASDVCQCDEAPMCLQSYPESCICEEQAKAACWNKCGGPKPQLTGCPALKPTDPKAAEQSKCLPEPFCATVGGEMDCQCRNAIAVNLMNCNKIFVPLDDCSATQDVPQRRAEAAVPGCTVGPLACELSADANSCECRNAVKKNKMTCTKIFFELEDCSAPQACQCEEIMCAQSWPESCLCENAAKDACYKKCGGVKPQLQTCPPQKVASMVRAVKRTA